MKSENKPKPRIYSHLKAKERKSVNMNDLSGVSGLIPISEFEQDNEKFKQFKDKRKQSAMYSQDSLHIGNTSKCENAEVS